MIATGTSLNHPFSGDIHPIYGLYMGGSKLTDDYTLKSKPSYKFTTQLRNPKKSSYFEQTLMKHRSNATSITFKGNSEINVPCITEYDKKS